ncbi:MAG TPA: tetratricopeptide repeat protein, partial [Chryseolinea sp.]
KETGSVLRPIDFIFKSSGVNRPLAHHDERKDNLNHTFYRDQINKVAIAMKEIVTAVKHPTAQAEAAAPTVPRSIQPKKGLSIQKMVMPAVIVILLAIIGYGATVFLKQGNIQAAAGNVDDVDRSIAVLPFANMSTDKEQEYFSDGLSEELLNVLAKIPSLKVISRTSAFSFKGKNEDIRMIGEKLGVAYLLEGSVRKSGEKVRITAQLIKASDGSHLWSETFDRDMNDIFKVQDEIANAVVGKLKGQLMGTDLSIAKESKPEVYNLWLESRFHQSKGTNEALEKGTKLAEQAIRLDSTDARVWAQLSGCYISLWGNMQDRNLGAKYHDGARSFAEKAISLAPNLTDGYTAMGFVYLMDSEMQEAARYYQKALDIDPTNTRSMISLAMALNALGEFSRAIVLMNKSIELDPLNSRCYLNLSSVQLATGDYEAALKSSTRSTELGSDNLFANIQHAICLMVTGQNDVGFQHLAKIEDPYWKEYCEILILWNAGQKDKSRLLLKKFETENKESGPFQIAEIYALYEEKDKAFEWLDLAFKYADPGLLDIKVSIFLKPYHDDPRYKAALKKLNLPV